jgi:hypothetical protein
MTRFLCLASIALLSSSGAASREAQDVAARFRHITFHLGQGVELRVDDLAGRLRSQSTGPPVFDDVKSYVLDIDSGRVAMSPESLTNLMNNVVFAGPGSPLSSIKVGIDGQELTQTGTLKKGIRVPFSMRASVAATSDGRIRLHPTSLKAAGFLSKRVLDFFGLELEKLVKMKESSGVVVDGDDLILDPGRLLPPPRVQGRVTRAWIENGALLEQFGTPSRSQIAPPGHQSQNYMYYRGGTLRFGKLTMTDTDLLLLDADQKDWFDFSPEQYLDQLVAGYSKSTRSGGLIVYMPDLVDLSRGSTRPAPSAETPGASKRHP